MVGRRAAQRTRLAGPGGKPAAARALVPLYSGTPPGRTSSSSRAIATGTHAAAHPAARQAKRCARFCRLRHARRPLLCRSTRRLRRRHRVHLQCVFEVSWSRRYWYRRFSQQKKQNY